MRLSWPVGHGNLALERKTDLNQSNWQAVNAEDAEGRGESLGMANAAG